LFKRLPFAYDGAFESCRDPADGGSELDEDLLHGSRSCEVDERGLLGYVAPVPVEQTHGCLHVQHRLCDRMT
jgi:hypothetical protein